VNGGYTARTPLPDFAMSPFRPFRCVALFALVALLLGGCGNKGDLVKPTPKPSDAPATPPPAAH
jgi:predicted small lipoprotein YifL